MSIWQVYKSLNEEQKQALASKQVKLHRPVDELIRFLQPIASCDRLGDKARTKFGCGGAIALVIVIPLLFMTISRAISSTVGILLMAIAVIAGILLLRTWSWMNKIDVSNNLRGVVLPVLAVFREDIDATQPVQLDLDLRAPTHDAKQKSKSEPYKKGVYHKIIDTIYVDPWMRGEAMLVDGTRLRWSVVDSIRERKKTKKNPRNKYKTKTKYAKKTDIDIELTMRAKTYDVAAVKDATVEAGAKKSAVSVRRRVRGDSLDPVNPRAFIDLVAGVYRNARPAK